MNGTGFGSHFACLCVAKEHSPYWETHGFPNPARTYRSVRAGLPPRENYSFPDPFRGSNPSGHKKIPLSGIPLFCVPRRIISLHERYRFRVSLRPMGSLRHPQPLRILTQCKQLHCSGPTTTLRLLVCPEGFEPSTNRLRGECSTS
jgi:hypothetical protein